MKIAIHQPEHFPYLGFFKKMEYADIFVLLDDAQFSKGNWHNRNKFLNKNNVEEWFTVELEKFTLGTPINEIFVNKKSNWKKKIISKLKQNFNFNLDLIYNHEKLIDINIDSINFCRKKLNITTPLYLSSELNIKESGSLKLSNICDYFEAKSYISGQGGINYLDESVFNCSVEYYDPKVKDFYTTLSHL